MKLHIGRRVLLLVMSLFVTCWNVQASDVAKEKRWADQVVDTLMVGDAQWLKADQHEFLSIYAENETDQAAGAVIIMHGIGIHPNWDTVIRPLRSDLPAKGWHTLSIQMPILENEATFKDYIPLFPEVSPRIQAATRFLKSKGIKNIVLLGHSLGATMGAYYMAGDVDPAITSFVAIGASAGSDSEVDYLKSLSKMHHPVLELYGSQDLEAVVSTAENKAATAAKAGLKDYRQIKVGGADHFFVGKNEELVRLVADWISRFSEQ